MIRALALDDEPPALQLIADFCTRTKGIELLRGCTRPAELLELLQQEGTDLLFLDINMPSVNGLAFYKALPQKIPVIFTTAYSEFAVESYEVNALDYLLKPFSFVRFQQAIEKARALLSPSVAELPESILEPQHLTLRVEYSLVKVNFSDILYIEALDNYLRVHLRNQNRLITRMTIKVILEKLPEKQFVRVHRSFIVPLAQVEWVRNRVIMLSGGQSIPLGRNYEKNFLSHFSQA